MSLRFKSLKHAQEILGDRVSLCIPIETKQNKRPKTKPTRELPEEDKLSPPHKKLWSHAKIRLARHNPTLEYKGSVPGRKFRIDIAFPERLLAVEVDGHRSHGKHRIGFEKDREKQNLLTLNGWKILRFSGREILQNIEGVISTIEEAL